MFRNQISYIIKSIFNKHEYTTLLGRWSHLSNKKDLNKRIDLANLDHCGCCGNYYVKKLNKD